MRKVIPLFIVLLFAGFSSLAQVRTIPAVVTGAFEKQYPTAREVEYRDMLTSIHVHFVLDSAHYTAKYTSKGEWKETEKEWKFEKFSPQVQDGFRKSKYSGEWKIVESAVIYMPGAERYRIKVEKNEVQKKYLFFDRNGRLIRDSLTL